MRKRIGLVTAAILCAAVSGTVLAQNFLVPTVSSSGSPSGQAEGTVPLGTINGRAGYPIGVFPGVNGANQLYVTLDPTQVFWDDFGTGTLDTTNRWTAPTTGGGGNATAANNAVGATTLGTGTQASGWSILQSQTTFPGRNPGYVFGQFNFKVGAASTTTGLFPINAYRFIGWYSAPGSPTVAAPLTNAVGLSIEGDGHARLITFASGTETVIADLTLFDQLCQCVPQSLLGTQVGPGGGINSDKLVIYFRGDSVVYKLNDQFIAQVLSGTQGPDVNTLAVGAMAVAGTTAIAATQTIELDQVTVGDTGRNNTRVCDATFGWRCGAVGALGGSSIQGDTADGQGNVTGGNPVKTGCIFNTGRPTYINGQIIETQCSSRGEVFVSQSALGLVAVQLADNADAVATSGAASGVKNISRGTVFNGLSWDRQPGSAAAGTQSTPVPPTAVQTGGSSGVIANAAATASITATATRFSFISGFQVTYDGATVGQCVNATLTGVVGGTRNYTVCSPTGVTLVAAPLVVTFNPPLSSTAVNTQISLSVPALGAGNTNTAVNVDGFN